MRSRVAISLLACNDMRLLYPCLTSLLASDLKDHDYKIFCVDNASRDNVCEFIQFLGAPLWLKQNATNEGIVVPRIEIMEQILREGYDYTLEIHADMLFPQVWLAPLIAAMDDHTGITMPFILNNNTKILQVAELETLVKRFATDGIVENVRQVHPWLLNNKVVAEVGYYDAQFSPQNCEDDDFIYRVGAAGYKTKAVRSSVVAHYGGITRVGLGNAYDTVHAHGIKFHAKNGLTIGDLIKRFTLHPIITGY
jgi:GT2 family glycosyltransferase